MIELRELTAEELEELQGMGFLRLKDILKIIPISKSLWYEGIGEGKYPQPIKLGPRISVWRKPDIKGLVEQINAENS